MTDDVAEERQTDDVEAVQHVEQSETPDQINQEAGASELTFWQKLRKLFGLSSTGRKAEIAQRLLTLDEVIAVHPDAASNYVTRGELYLELRQDELAALDFQRALEIAAHDLESDRWGVVAQAIQDRAQRGLKIAQKRLKHESLSVKDVTQ